MRFTSICWAELIVSLQMLDILTGHSLHSFQTYSLCLHKLKCFRTDFIENNFLDISQYYCPTYTGLNPTPPNLHTECRRTCVTQQLPLFCCTYTYVHQMIDLVIVMLECKIKKKCICTCMCTCTCT